MCIGERGGEQALRFFIKGLLDKWSVATSRGVCAAGATAPLPFPHKRARRARFFFFPFEALSESLALALQPSALVVGGTPPAVVQAPRASPPVMMPKFLKDAFPVRT